jgi:hypothetical protein
MVAGDQLNRLIGGETTMKFKNPLKAEILFLAIITLLIVFPFSL